MIIVDNRGVNMTLINESIISLPSSWPLAMHLIKLSARAALHPGGRAVQRHSEFLNKLTTPVFISQPVSLPIATQVRLHLIRLSSKTSFVNLYLYSARIWRSWDEKQKMTTAYIYQMALTWAT